MIRLVNLSIKNFKQYESAKLTFPEKGRILIKGKNEAGKSTLFEAIVFALFGKTVYLLKENEHKPLINFNSDSATVNLVVQTDTKILNISRTIYKNSSSQQCILEIKSSMGELITRIRKVKEAGERIIKELGIDYNILINTCFVGQKKLEGLEELDKSKRESIISKIFNLEYLEKAKEEAKKQKDIYERELQNYEIIKKASDAKRNLPIIQRKLEKVAERKKEIESIEKSKEIYRIKNEINELTKNIEKIDEELKVILSEVEKLNKYREEKIKIEEILNIKDKIKIFEEQKEKLEKEIRDYQERLNSIPLLEESLKTLNHGIHIKERFRKIEDYLEKYKIGLEKKQEDLFKWQKQYENLKEIEEKTKKIPRLEKEIKSLSRNINLIKREERIQELFRKVKDLEEREKTLSILLEIENYKKEREKVIPPLKRLQKKSIVYTLLSVIFFIFTFSSNFIFVIPSLSLLVLLYFTYKKYSGLKEKLIKLQNIIEIKSSGIQEKLGDYNEIFKELERIKKLKERKVLQFERILTKIKEKTSRLELSLLIEEKTRKEKDLQNLKQEEENFRKGIEELSRVIKSKEDICSIGEKLIEISENIEKENNKKIKIEKIIEKLGEKDLFPAKSLSDLSREKGNIEGEKRNIENLKIELRKKQKDIENLNQQIINLNEELKNKLKEITFPITKEYLTELNQKIKNLLDKDVEKISEKLKEESNRKKGERDNQIRNIAILIKEFEESFPEKNWEELYPIEINPMEKIELENREKELLGEEREKIKLLEEYELKTGKKKEDLDPDKVEEEYIKIQKEILKLSYVTNIVDMTKDKMLKSVLPKTMAYMQKILPILTMDRYHYAEIDDENYQLKVYTNFSEVPIEKKLFSGGTQDQLSLALRLSFAMATLPQNKGVQPAFIFLDEPLGSFDEERKRALVNLLTQGEVAEHFDQIFVITHVPIEEDFFDRIIYVDNGRIAEKEIEELE